MSLLNLNQRDFENVLYLFDIIADVDGEFNNIESKFIKELYFLKFGKKLEELAEREITDIQETIENIDQDAFEDLINCIHGFVLLDGNIADEEVEVINLILGEKSNLLSDLLSNNQVNDCTLTSALECALIYNAANIDGLITDEELDLIKKITSDYGFNNLVTSIDIEESVKVSRLLLNDTKDNLINTLNDIISSDSERSEKELNFINLLK